MTLRYYRFFGGLLNTQQKWLNNMASKGYRLVKVNKLMYEFEKSNKEVQYNIEFVAYMSNDKLKDYIIFLEDLGYRVFTKNINLNWSLGKIRLRPYGKPTTLGNYNKELLIVEKYNDGKVFQLHSTSADKAEYIIKNA